MLKVTTTGNVSLPEIGRVVPAAAGYDLHPTFDVKADGPTERLALDCDVKSEAGNIRGQVDGRRQGAGLRACAATSTCEQLDLAPILKDPCAEDAISRARDPRSQDGSEPATAPVVDRIKRDIRVRRAARGRGRIRRAKRAGRRFPRGTRITLDGGAAAYGGTATARGFIVTPAPGRPLAFDLGGSAEHVDLAKLPASTGAPKLATNLSVADYHVIGQGPSINGTATLNQSTVEGATHRSRHDRDVRPGAVGNLVHRREVRSPISTCTASEVRSRSTHWRSRRTTAASMAASTWRAACRGRRPAAAPPRTPAPAPVTAVMKLDASGTLTNSAFMGGTFPELEFEAHLDRGALTGRAAGNFRGFNPGQIAARKELDGNVSGTVDANFAIRDIDAPITADAITAEGKLGLTQSTVAGCESRRQTSTAGTPHRSAT